MVLGEKQTWWTITNGLLSVDSCPLYFAEAENGYHACIPSSKKIIFKLKNLVKIEPDLICSKSISVTLLLTEQDQIFYGSLF